MFRDGTFIPVGEALAVPVYPIHPRKQVQLADAGHPNGTVDEDLAVFSQMKVPAGSYCVRELAASNAHTDGLHDVWWFDRPGPSVGIWTTDSAGKLVHDSTFLDALQVEIRRRQQENARLNAYMLIGHSRVGVHEGHQLPRSLQSIERWHMHITELLSPGLLPSRHLDHMNHADLRRIVMFANFAGYISTDTFSRELAQFGVPYQAVQHVGDNREDPYTLERLFFGFRSLADALPCTLELQEQARRQWERHTLYVYGYSAGSGTVHVPVMQTPAPSFSVIVPSPEIRGMWYIPDEITVLVQPFAVCGPPNVLKPGGAWLEWK